MKNKMKNTNSKDNIQLQYLKGIGPRRAESLAKENIFTLKDLISYFPKSYIDRNHATSLNSIIQAKQNIEANNLFENKNIDMLIKNETMIFARITDKSLKTLGRNKTLFTLKIKDEFGDFAKINFWRKTKYFERTYQVGMFLIVSGKADVDKFGISFTHPDIDIITEEDKELYNTGVILPKYKITENFNKNGITSKLLRNIISSIIDKELNNNIETLPNYILDKYSFPSLSSTIKKLHFPKSKEELNASIFRMKFEEFFYYQLKLNYIKNFNKTNHKSCKFDKKSILARKLFDKLNFRLTKDQKSVLKEIDKELRSGKAMNRLLQGDVGSGKTIVSIFLMLMCIDNGYQAAIMAPTEILAEQHFLTIKNYLTGFDIEISLLTGGLSQKIKNEEYIKIKSGDRKIIIGTHAIFQKKVDYNKLSLIIIDEQHRFGVEQRKDLIDKAINSFRKKDMYPHLLYMSATPIPRTLTMSAYGDLDISTIKTMPLNRKEIITKVRYEEDLNDIHNFIRQEVKSGRQVYIVYPLVEKSEKLELKSASEQFEKFNKIIFPDIKCGLLHGQMNWKEKDQIMNDFLNKNFDLLIATTVIEVGINIPNASLMIIENAERFGLSQLHQLRGRVGRGKYQSYCILVTKDHYKFLIKSNSNNLKENEKLNSLIRLKTIENNLDGFEISEVDLKLRGPGDMLGTKQSGIPNFQFADLLNDSDLLIETKILSEELIKSDPDLTENKNLRIRNYLLSNGVLKENYFNIS